MSEIVTKPDIANSPNNLSSTVKTASKEHEIDLKDFLFKLLAHWQWFILSVAFCFSYGIYKIYEATPLYSSNELVLIKDARSGSDEFMLEMAGMARSNMENEIAVLTSPDLSCKVIKELDLCSTYYLKGKFGMANKELYKGDCPLYVHTEGRDPDSIENVRFEFAPLNDQFEVTVFGRTYLIKRADMPIILELPEANSKYLIDMKKGFEMPENNIIVDVINPRISSWSYASQLSVEEASENSTLLGVAIFGQHPVKCRDFLLKLIEVYNEETRQDKIFVSKETSTFINARIEAISKELAEEATRAEDFRKIHGITDLVSTSNTYTQRTNISEQQITDIQAELILLGDVEKMLASSESDKSLTLPSIPLSDASTAHLIERYNDAVLTRTKLFGASKDINPAFIQASKDIESLRGIILQSIANIRKRAMLSIDNLRQQQRLTQARAMEVPVLDRKLEEITRQQSVKVDLYTYLLRKREETALAQAAISPKAKIITEPVVSYFPISPNRQKMMMYSILAGLFIPIGVIVIRDFFRTRIESREDLMKILLVPFIGEISKSVDNSTVVVRKNVNSSIIELFRALRNSINFVIGNTEKKVILVTSTLAGEGKTFVSINLAMSYALMNKKVILIGLDIRNPKIAQNLGVKRTIGITSYLSGDTDDLDSLIIGTPFHENLSLLQSGSVPPNPNELLVSQRLDDAMLALRAKYDMIVVDTAPIGLVSDTFLLNRISDMFVYVTRENVTPKETVSFINNIYEEKRLTNLYVLLNATEFNKKKYGYARYKYGYKYYYGYHSKRPKQ
ncbi:MAG: polysaccharide biosynthesis tyrosine autokinase [Bacteroidales bacterium]|jgi:capsular exopolysaccharide synthesis family protein|nr:polysaccharide biosynthesis tyrosine autokinase [Bacteroidales bacterium]